ncbi:hypothetical protein K8R66_02455, partial [bacterium]|nr:hypothetical protein [bacterium]
MNLIKKLFVFTVICSLAFGMLAPVNVAEAADITAGDLIKSDVSSAVYYYDGSQRLAFPNPSVYFSWYEDFSTVKTISATELAEVTYNGTLVTMRAGTKLVKIESDPKVYAVEPGSVLRHVADEATAIALYGSDWSSMVVDVSDAFWFWYDKTDAVDNAVTADAHPEGTLIRYAGLNDVYYIEGTTKRLVSTEGFAANMFSEEYVVENVADTIAYTNGSSVTVAEDALFPITESNTTVPDPVGSATVALSATNPISGTAVKKAARYPMLEVNVTAGSDAAVSVKLKVQRSGLSANTDFTSISFLEGSKQIGNTKTLNSNNECLSDSINVPAGTTKTIVVAGNIRSDGTDTSGGTAVFSVT